jgi:hypothetical protein
MLHREIIAVCSHIHAKHINTMRGQNVELLNVKLAVHIVTTGLLIVQPDRDYCATLCCVSQSVSMSQPSLP